MFIFHLNQYWTMKFRNYMIVLIFLLVNLLSLGHDFDDYQRLKKENVASIKREDLPREFSDEAFQTVDEFIKKTRNLDFECALFFDYISGEVLKFGKGVGSNVKLTYETEEFLGKHVASIHNHPKKAFGPPSGKNFNILTRSFEDYELVVGRDGIWILKAKGMFKNLISEVRSASEFFYILTSVQCEISCEDIDKINECNDELYGNMLLNYINNKNINDIQLVKREYEDD